MQLYRKDKKTVRFMTDLSVEIYICFSSDPFSKKRIYSFTALLFSYIDKMALNMLKKENCLLKRLQNIVISLLKKQQSLQKTTT